jgi:uncharacterized protein DUF5678
MPKEEGEQRDMAEVLREQVQAERQLSHELERFVGRWVAVRNHAVVGDAETLDELLEEIEPESVESVFEVVEQGTACFY